MKSETLFENFDLFADTPNAVAKMREFVLEMALQGRLSQQCAEDARDPEWLELVSRIDADTKLATARTAPTHEIPRSWRWTTLESLGEPKPRNDAPDRAQASFVPMTLIPAAFGQNAQHAVRTWGEIKKGYTHFKDGDVVMAKITPCFENGKSAIMTGLTGGIGAGTTELHVFRRSGAVILPEFVIIQLKSRGYIMRGIPRMTGSAGQKRVPYDYFAREPFPIPPPGEQKRIVAKVHALMALCDRLETQNQERETRHAALADAALTRFADAPTPTNLKLLFHKSYSIAPADLRKSILTLAIQGKLVPQDVTDEPASDALRRLETKGGNSKTRRSVPTDVARPETLDEQNLPDSWVIESTARLLQIGAITDLKDGNHGANHPKVAEFTETGLPFITAAQVSDEGEIDYEGAYKVSGEALQRLRVGFAKPNDVIYTHKGSVGRVAICNRECVLTPQTTYYRLNSDVLSSGFIRTVLCSSFFRDQVDLVKRQTTRDFVPINAQYQFFLRVPPIAEQRRIVAKVDDLMDLVNRLETQLALVRATGLTLAEAIIDELTAEAGAMPVPQLPPLDSEANPHELARPGKNRRFDEVIDGEEVEGIEFITTVNAVKTKV